MPDFAGWLNWHDTDNLEGWLDDYPRAAGVAFMIGHKGVQLTLVRGATALSPQWVVLVPASTVSRTQEFTTETGVGGKDVYYVIGCQDHPTVADLDIRKGDRFVLDGAHFEITFVDYTMAGKIEARAESMR